MSSYKNPSLTRVFVTNDPVPRVSPPSGTLEHWKIENRRLWVQDYWPQHLNVDPHYSISMHSNGWFAPADLPYITREAHPEFKLLYDSYFWKVLLQQLGTPAKRANVLELLPGRTFTLPVALESLGFKGSLDRLDLSPQPPGLEQFSFSCHWLNTDLFRFPFDQPTYELLVANHVIDDLMMYIHFHGPYCQQPAYSSSRESLLAWREIAALDETAGYSQRVTEFLRSLVMRLPAGAIFVLREYPSTFELTVGDVDRISYLRTVFVRIVARLRDIPGISGGWVHLENKTIPKGERYPNSMFVLRK